MCWMPIPLSILFCLRLIKINKFQHFLNFFWMESWMILILFSMHSFSATLFNVFFCLILFNYFLSFQLQAKAISPFQKKKNTNKILKTILLALVQFPWPRTKYITCSCTICHVWLQHFLSLYVLMPHLTPSLPL